MNRLDDIIAFRRIDEQDISQIVELMLKNTFERIAKKGIAIIATDEAKSKAC